MFKNLQAGGEGTVQGTEGANAQRHEGPVDPPEKGRPGQVREVSLISAGPLSSGPQEGLDGPGYLAESVGLEEARPLVPFLGKKSEQSQREVGSDFKGQPNRAQEPLGARGRLTFPHSLPFPSSLPFPQVLSLLLLPYFSLSFSLLPLASVHLCTFKSPFSQRPGQ